MTDAQRETKKTGLAQEVSPFSLLTIAKFVARSIPSRTPFIPNFKTIIYMTPSDTLPISSSIEEQVFHRTRLLVGSERLSRLHKARVILFGVGGVGSWCAESLVRSGIRHLTIVDSDRVAISNVNRQLPATLSTVGRVKVEVLKERLLSLNPEAQIDARQEIYDAQTSASFHLDEYDVIIDAIDSLAEKAHLILAATATRALFVSSMGAALKMDPTRIGVAEFWKVKGCPLARALRGKFKRNKTFPSRKFLTVFSDELLPNLGQDEIMQPETKAIPVGEGRTDLSDHDWNAKKAQINGTVAHITAIFGFTLAGVVVQEICKEKSQKP